MRYHLKLYHDDHERIFLFDTDAAMTKIDKATGSKALAVAMVILTLFFVILPAIN